MEQKASSLKHVCVVFVNVLFSLLTISSVELHVRSNTHAHHALYQH